MAGRIDPAIEAKVASMLEQGMTPSQVHRATGMHKCTISRIRRDCGMDRMDVAYSAAERRRQEVTRQRLRLSPLLEAVRAAADQTRNANVREACLLIAEKLGEVTA